MESAVILKSQPEIRRMKQVATTLPALFESIYREGPTYWSQRHGGDMDRYVRSFLARRNLQSAMLGYDGFPGHACVSPNSIAGHGVPTNRKFSMGDIITVDVAARGSGWVADAAWTYVFPGAPGKTRRLQRAAWVLTTAIVSSLGPGVTIGHMVNVTTAVAKRLGIQVIPDFVGHGIGRELHEAPVVPFVFSDRDSPGREVQFMPGMVVSIEPVVTFGCGEVVVTDDGWSYRTKDGNVTAQYELTIAITENGTSVLTLGGVAGRDLPKEAPFSVWDSNSDFEGAKPHSK